MFLVALFGLISTDITYSVSAKETPDSAIFSRCLRIRLDEELTDCFWQLGKVGSYVLPKVSICFDSRFVGYRHNEFGV